MLGSLYGSIEIKSQRQRKAKTEAKAKAKAKAGAGVKAGANIRTFDPHSALSKRALRSRGRKEIQDQRRSRLSTHANQERR